eukprot:scaffold149351_cov17-Tisochrysis_lutea.AAC.1
MHTAQLQTPATGSSSSLSERQQPTLTPDAAALLLVGLPDLGRLWGAEPALVLVAVAAAGAASAADVHGDAMHGSSTRARFLVRLLRGIGAHVKLLRGIGAYARVSCLQAEYIGGGDWYPSSCPFGAVSRDARSHSRYSIAASGSCVFLEGADVGLFMWWDMRVGQTGSSTLLGVFV